MGDDGFLRWRFSVHGAVQGVGFRPFVYRLARELGLCGWVGNDAQGVAIEVEGRPPLLAQFRDRLERERPPRSSIQRLDVRMLDPVGHPDFTIRPSGETGPKAAVVLPDIAVCAACLAEMSDPADRRHSYPFTNCTNCGPRFTILERLPYDRANTSMKRFTMCDACRAEYEDPGNRRFHAQPNACPACGPQLEWWTPAGEGAARRGEALGAAVEAVRLGRIVAVKGLGGFHLLVDARSEEAVARLRRRKRREEKPFAVMVASLAAARELCELSAEEEDLLASPEAPIVLLRARANMLAAAVAPGNPRLGLFLPYTPLHHLLLRELGAPVVATSGNLLDEPICIDEREARDRLGEIADGLLVHDRPIVRPADDSVVRVVLGRPLVLRRARGYAPLSIPQGAEGDGPPVLAVGAHFKNAVALRCHGTIHLGPHVGDLETVQADAALRGTVDALESLYDVRPTVVACDLHPDYRSTRLAEERSPSPVRVQHHHAHVAACLIDNGLEGPVLGVAWDGAGWGPDGTVWGGEFLVASLRGYSRIARFRPFPLPGADRAAREPWRAALGALYEVLGDGVFSRGDLAPLRACAEAERRILRGMLRSGVQAPRTSSVGRLFDAVASILDLAQRNRFEGQAAMAVEFAAEGVATEEGYPCEFREGTVDWAPILLGILADVDAGLPVGRIAARFQNALGDTIPAVARTVGEDRVVLTGGCFQNARLLERSVRRLQEEGYQPYWHRRVPPNDGGVAVGQAAVAARSRGDLDESEGPCVSPSRRATN